MPDDNDIDEVLPVRSERDQPQRRQLSPHTDDEEEGDVTGGLIPYKNPKALAAYYCAIFSLIPCVGLVLGPIAMVLGLLGWNYWKMHPTAAGALHALVGIVLGGLVLIGHLIAITFFVLAAMNAS